MPEPRPDRMVAWRRLCVLAGMVSWAAGCASPAPPETGTPPKEHPPDAAREISDEKPFDHRPYEFIWSPRREPHDPLVDFSFVLGWTAEASAGLTAAFERSGDEQLWGPYTARLSVSGDPADSAAGEVWIRPPEPIPIRNRFDSVSLWFREDPAQSSGDGHRVIRARIEDADNRFHDLRLDADRVPGWQLSRTRLQPQELDAMSQPCRFVGLLLEFQTAAASITNYMDSLTFYTEELNPLSFNALPSRNLNLFPGQSAGLHSGPTRLGFPTREDALQAGDEEPRPRNRVEKSRDGVFDLFYQGTDGTLRWQMIATNLPQGLVAMWNGVEVGRFFVDAGMKGPDLAESGVAVLRIEGESVHVEFQNGSSYRVSIHGKTIDISARNRGGAVDSVELGRYEGPMRWSEVDIPGLPAGEAACGQVGRLDAPGMMEVPTLFAGAFVDWYRSNGSAIVRSPESGRIAVRYNPVTDGSRNDAYERILFTLSPSIDDVLPDIPNPAGIYRDRIRSNVWIDAEAFTSYEAALSQSREWSLLGLTNVMQGHLCYTWRDGFESCGLRTRAAPGRGGDDALRAFLSGQRALGWEPGLLVDYLNLHPLNEYWSEDRLQRTRDLNWRRGRPGHYRIKTPASVELAGRIAPVLRARFAPRFAYVSTTTAHPPWDHIDYDARVPGAGTFSQPYYCIGGLLEAEGRHHEAPVIGDGGCEAFYAGLMDGYLVAGRASRSATAPYLPLFVHLKLNPLSCGIGSGGFWRYHGVAPGEVEITDTMVDQYLADQIAFGATGRLVPSEAGVLRQARSYYLMQQLQTRYAGKRPDRIAYWNGRALVNTSEAIVSGALGRSQIYLMYGEDLEVWVNGSANENWTVRVGADQWELPPFGWVASGPGFLQVSAQIEGRRIDYIDHGGERYFDGRGDPRPFRGLASATPIVVQSREQGGKRVYDVLDIAAAGQFGLGAFADADEQPVIARYLDRTNTQGGTMALEREQDLYWVRGDVSAIRYVIELRSEDTQAAGVP